MLEVSRAGGLLCARPGMPARWNGELLEDTGGTSWVENKLAGESEKTEPSHPDFMVMDRIQFLP